MEMHRMVIETGFGSGVSEETTKWKFRRKMLALLGKKKREMCSMQEKR